MVRGTLGLTERSSNPLPLSLQLGTRGWELVICVCVCKSTANTQFYFFLNIHFLDLGRKIEVELACQRESVTGYNLFQNVESIGHREAPPADDGQHLVPVNDLFTRGLQQTPWGPCICRVPAGRA